MKMTCHKCGYSDEYTEFPYLCKNGCPACGESDLRKCPQCGAECVLSRSEALFDEEIEMQEMSKKLASIQKTDDMAVLEEARKIIVALRSKNKRWNSPGLAKFLTERQRELFF